MSHVVDRLHGWLAALIQAGGATLIFGVVGALLGVLTALAVVWACGRLLRLRHTRSVSVGALAAGGMSRSEIARRTGLSQDAVGMLLRVRTTPGGRRKVPVTARIAASHHVDAARRNRDWNPQHLAGARPRAGDGELADAAQALPFTGSTVTRLTRSGRAA